MKENTCLTCMFIMECGGPKDGKTACNGYMRDPFKLAKGEAKWTFKRKAKNEQTHRRNRKGS